MKQHLTNGYSIACGRSGRRNQSKGVIHGMTPRYFAQVPEDERCQACNRRYQSVTKLKTRRLKQVGLDA